MHKGHNSSLRNISMIFYSFFEFFYDWLEFFKIINFYEFLLLFNINQKRKSLNKKKNL